MTPTPPDLTLAARFAGLIDRLLGRPPRLVPVAVPVAVRRTPSGRLPRQGR